MDTISDVKIDDSTLIQYEIEATPEELENLQHLLTETQAHDMELRNLFTFRHYDDKLADDDRKEFQNGLTHTFQRLYELGTPETKQRIEEIHMNE